MKKAATKNSNIPVRILISIASYSVPDTESEDPAMVYPNEFIISQDTGIDVADVREFVTNATCREWDDGRPWVYVVKGGYGVTSEGLRVIEESTGNHHIFTAECQKFKTEVLLGMDDKGQETKIKGAALPQKPALRVSKNDHEEKMFSSVKQYRASKGADTKLCARCKGLLFLTAFGKKNNRTKSWCKRCEALEERRRRRRKKGVKHGT